MPAKISLNRVNHLTPTPVADIGVRVGQIGSFLVYVNNCCVSVIDSAHRLRRYDGELCARTVMTVQTHWLRRAGIRYRVMGYTQMDNRYRGCGISAAVYEMVAKCGPIMSGSVQSPGGRSIWNRLAARGRLTVRALWKGQLWEVEPTEFSEVDGVDFDVYNNSCRLVAA